MLALSHHCCTRLCTERLAHLGPWGETWRAWWRIRVESPGPLFLGDCVPSGDTLLEMAQREDGPCAMRWSAMSTSAGFVCRYGKFARSPQRRPHATLHMVCAAAMSAGRNFTGSLV
ncbi:hypothetical protein B1H41_04800 [Xanthomonas vasicola pv. vasculorum]|nr:hypothetical protein B1H41_04800 [Xanthomonas vasicola pv. vasculorum]OWF64947.1 hypothetical protein B1H32_00330 [Xanthomonas vasicola pv. vasculorum]